MSTLNNQNLIVTGIPRSGTTLTTALIDSLSNSVCLSEPPWQGRIFKKHLKVYETVRQLENDFLDVRSKIIKQRPIKDRREEGGVPLTNYINYSEKGKAITNKSVNQFILHVEDKDFLLGMKSNASYTSILPELSKSDFFSFLAIIRHPIPTILSWQKVNFPISMGRLPGAEYYWPEIKSVSREDVPLLVKQVKIYELFCERYLSLSDRIYLLKYEDLLESPSIIETLTGKAFERKIEIQNQNRNRHYDLKMVDKIREYIEMYAPNAKKLYSLEDF